MGAGAAAGSLVSQAIAQRTESAAVPPPLQFINKKPGTHPFRANPPRSRPNIFVITLDMVTPDHYHPTRTLHREMNLPAIRGLFRDSVVFNNAFCASPLCAPAMLERDSRWIGYSSPFRIDHYADLPKPKGDVQMFRPI